MAWMNSLRKVRRKSSRNGSKTSFPRAFFGPSKAWEKGLEELIGVFGEGDVDIRGMT